MAMWYEDGDRSKDSRGKEHIQSHLILYRTGTEPRNTYKIMPPSFLSSCFTSEYFVVQ